MWGYGVDPPADFNPHPVSCHACQPDPAGNCSWRAITLRWAWLLPPQVQVIMAVGSRASDRLNRPVQRRLE
jgi:hypothetical protein